jgi:hypothetical protein
MEGIDQHRTVFAVGLDALALRLRTHRSRA